MAEPDLPAVLSADRFELIGYDDLGGRAGFKLAVREHAGRWYLYLCYHRAGGWAVYDVTEPTRPRHVQDIPFSPTVMTNQIQVANGMMVTSLQHFKAAMGSGPDPEDPADEGFLVWAVSDPEDKPQLLGHWRSGAGGCHRNYFDGGRYVHSSAGMPGLRGQGYAIVDIEDPQRPVTVGRFWLPEQELSPRGRSREVYLHGPPHPRGSHVYLPYGRAGLVTLDISDPAVPQLVDRLDFGKGLAGGVGIHSAVPVPGRDLVVVNSEPHSEEQREPGFIACLVDISTPEAPYVVSILPTPHAPSGAPYSGYSRRGARFGPHNQHHSQGHRDLFESQNLVFMLWYGAGLRLYDISRATEPVEIGHLQPADPTSRRHTHPSQLVFQGNDVIVDRRGYVYFTEMNSGLYVAKFERPSSAISHGG